MTPVRMRKANGERLVPPEKVAEYLELGYSVIDSEGHVIKRPDPKTPAEFKAAVAEMKKDFDEKEKAFFEKEGELLAQVSRYEVLLVEKEHEIDVLHSRIEGLLALKQSVSSETAQDVPKVAAVETATATAETAEIKPQKPKRGTSAAREAETAE